MKITKMQGVALTIGKGGIAIILGDNEQMALRLMQLLNAETEDDLTMFDEDVAFSMVDAEDEEEY